MGLRAGVDCFEEEINFSYLPRFKSRVMILAYWAKSHCANCLLEKQVYVNVDTYPLSLVSLKCVYFWTFWSFRT